MRTKSSLSGRESEVIHSDDALSRVAHVGWLEEFVIDLFFKRRTQKVAVGGSEHSESGKAPDSQ